MPSVNFRIANLTINGSRRLPVADIEEPWDIFGAFLSAECRDTTAPIHGEIEHALRSIDGMGKC